MVCGSVVTGCVVTSVVVSCCVVALLEKFRLVASTVETFAVLADVGTWVDIVTSSVDVFACCVVSAVEAVLVVSFLLSSQQTSVPVQML